MPPVRCGPVSLAAAAANSEFNRVHRVGAGGMIGAGDRVSATSGVSTRAADTGAVGVGLNGETKLRFR
jgi:hypothetical protein